VSLDFANVLLIGLVVAVVVLGSGTTHAMPSVETKRPTLTIMTMNPLRVAGRGFKASERVIVSVGPRRKADTAGPRGRFTIQFGRTRCTSGTIVAIGSRGSRAAVKVPDTLCFEP
jgi:hypothetical protein